MRLRRVTDATVEPVTRDAAKLYARIDTADEDAQIDGLIIAARRRVESETGLALVTQTWALVLDRWPGEHPSGLSPWWDGVKEGPIALVTGAPVIEIPKRPYQSANSVKLRDAYGVQSTVDPSIYFDEVSDYRGRIVKKLGYVWPIVIISPTAAIEVEFKAGFGDTAASVPEDLALAVKMLVKHWYDNREPVADGRVAPIPMHIDSILAPWRALRLA